MIHQCPYRVGIEKPELILCSYINMPLCANSYRPYLGAIRNSIYFPSCSVKFQQPIVVGNVEDTVAVLCDPPVLNSGAIVGGRVIGNEWKARKVMGPFGS